VLILVERGGASSPGLQNIGNAVPNIVIIDLSTRGWHAETPSGHRRI
jgi:hypothetical protein